MFEEFSKKLSIIMLECSLHQPRAAPVIDASDRVSRVGNLDSFAPLLFTHGSHKSSVRSLDPRARSITV